jgi:hypothetical protein
MLSALSRGRGPVTQALEFNFVGILVLLILWSSLRSVSQRLRGLERDASALLRHFNIDPTIVGPPSEEVKRLARDPRQKIEAMRLFRRETGADVKTARETIEALAGSA